VWAHSAYERNTLSNGDLQEGLRAAAAVGDDRLQKQATGRVDRETWTHGSSAERARWFKAGFDSGSASSCETFAARSL
jgi:predicted metalloprotease